MTPDEIIEVVQAHKEGKAIESRIKDDKGYSLWFVTTEPCWNFGTHEYRIAKPKPREFWMVSHVADGKPCSQCGSFDTKESALKSNGSAHYPSPIRFIIHFHEHHQ